MILTQRLASTTIRSERRVSHASLAESIYPNEMERTQFGMKIQLLLSL